MHASIVAEAESMTTTSPITLYGIPNCSFVKKGLDWLRDQNRSFVFHDFKKAGVPEPELDAWISALGWEALVNRKGTTWRNLPPDLQAQVLNNPSANPSARALMLSHPSVIKRPVIDWGTTSKKRFTVGFTPEDW